MNIKIRAKVARKPIKKIPDITETDMLKEYVRRMRLNTDNTIAFPFLTYHYEKFTKEQLLIIINAFDSAVYPHFSWERGGKSINVSVDDFYRFVASEIEQQSTT